MQLANSTKRSLSSDKGRRVGGRRTDRIRNSITDTQRVTGTLTSACPFAPFTPKGRQVHCPDVSIECCQSLDELLALSEVLLPCWRDICRLPSDGHMLSHYWQRAWVIAETTKWDQPTDRQANWTNERTNERFIPSTFYTSNNPIMLAYTSTENSVNTNTDWQAIRSFCTWFDLLLCYVNSMKEQREFWLWTTHPNGWLPINLPISSGCLVALNQYWALSQIDQFLVVFASDRVRDQPTIAEENVFIFIFYPL